MSARPSRRGFRPALFVGLAAACCASFAGAAEVDRISSRYLRDQWGAERGFPEGPVYAIAQAADGYLWIGTARGLVRFDGIEFNVVPPAISPAPWRPDVLGLSADAAGDLWARLLGSNVLRYHGGRFENVMAEGLTSDSGVTAFCRGRGESMLLSAQTNGTLRWTRGKFEVLAPANALPPTPVLAMAETASGTVWLGTRDAGLFAVSEGKAVPVVKGLPDAKVNCLLATGGEELWVGTDDGVVRWTGTELSRAGLPAALDHVQALALVQDRQANLWVGTGHGLLRSNVQGASSLDEGDRSDAVTALFEDREGNIWAGSTRGLERLRDRVFMTYSREEGLPSVSNGPVYAAADDRLWFGPSRGGLYWLDQGKVGHLSKEQLDEDVVYSIAGSPGELWVGRRRGGLTHLVREGLSWKARTYRQADGLAQDSVYTVHRSRDGTVWAGTLSGGVSRLRNERFTTFTTADGLASNTVTSIVDAADGTSWFATPNGVSAFANDHWRTYVVADGLPSENVNCLFEDSKGVLWVGTARGLAFLDSGRFHLVGAAEPLRAPVFGIAEDQKGRLWLSTSRQVFRVDRDPLLRGAAEVADVSRYGLAEGLLGIEGVKRQRSVVTDAHGRIWFSMNRALSVVDPGRITSASAPALAHIEAVSADGRAIGLQDPVRIPAGSQRVNVSYAGVSLTVPERVRFRYRLDGFDRGWSDPIATRQAVYTNLGPGSYQFRLMASNSEGLWNGSEATVRIVVEPVFWQALWFQVSAVLGAGLAVLVAYRWRLRQVNRQLSVRFEERLAERTRVAQALHDTLLQGFLSASMQMHVALEQVPAASPAEPGLRRVLELMGRVVDEGRNAVRGLRSFDQGTDDLELAFSRIQQELDFRGQVDCRVIVEGSPRPLHPIIRDEVYSIGREALVNAFRHAQARSIEVELEYSARALRVQVRDDGRGIDEQVLRTGREGHWGLSGMRERAERIGARLKVWSRVDAGTEVDLSVPGHIAFKGRAPAGPSWLGRWRMRDNVRADPGNEPKQ